MCNPRRPLNKNRPCAHMEPEAKSTAAGVRCPEGMVIPREHYESFSDLPDDLAAELIVHVKQLLSAIRAVCRPDGMAHMSDDDFSDVGYNLVRHYKFHVFPRYSDDGIVQKWSRVPDPGDEGRERLANSLRGAMKSR